MTAKFLIAVFVAWLGWRLWHGPSRRMQRIARVRDDLAEARALLGVDDEAGEAEVRAAHRRLVAEVHPDRGGSTEATRRLNAARDLLLRQPSVANSKAI